MNIDILGHALRPHYWEDALRCSLGSDTEPPNFSIQVLRGKRPCEPTESGA